VRSLRGFFIVFLSLTLTLSLTLVLLLSSSKVAFAQQPQQPPADPQAKEKSRAAFRRGVIQLKAQEWAGARASFEEAWSLVQHPSILLNLGIARLKTDDPVLAEADLVRFLSEDPGAAADEIASARDALAEARSKIGTLRVVATPATARVVIDGKPTPIRANGDAGTAEARLKAGNHTVAVDAEGYNATEKAVDLPAKSETEVKISLTPKEGTAPPGGGVVVKPKPPSRSPTTRTIVGWSLAGVGAGALVASGIMGLRAISLSSDYEDESNRASFQNADVKDEGITFRTGADIAFVAALLAGAGAVILLFTDIGEPKGAGVAANNILQRSRSPLLRW
jgi:hypothetical protein